PHRDARVRLRGLQAEIVPGRTGRVIDRKAAAALILGSFGSLQRDPITLRRRVDRPRVTARMLRPVERQVTIALSAPVSLTLEAGGTQVEPERLAQLLELPQDGERGLAIGGPKADAYFRGLAKKVDKAPQDAGFQVGSGGTISVEQSVDGRTLDVGGT